VKIEREFVTELELTSQYAQHVATMYKSGFNVRRGDLQKLKKELLKSRELIKKHERTLAGKKPGDFTHVSPRSRSTHDPEKVTSLNSVNSLLSEDDKKNSNTDDNTTDDNTDDNTGDNSDDNRTTNNDRNGNITGNNTGDN